tara:strand:+ start:2643 stop:2924 length:282 start_codon:yes stop_codon:yes gene_type:complete
MATITLEWDPPTTGGPVNTYKVYRRIGTSLTSADVKATPDSGFPIDVAPDPNSAKQTYADTPLASTAGAHCWVVTAWNAGGESDPSNVTEENV